MKMRTGISVVICLLLFLTGCSYPNYKIKRENQAAIQLELEQDSTPQKDGKDLSKGDLRAMFEEKNNEEVLNFLYTDYNRDGRHEAFVLTRGKRYVLWYISPEEFEQVRQFDDIREKETGILSFVTKEYVSITEVRSEQPVSYVFSVDNRDRVLETGLSGRGHIYRNLNRDIQFDVVDEKNGTTGTYYLYYSMDEGFKEFGAIPISREQFLEYDGAEEILKELDDTYGDEGVEYQFLYRSNSVIQINLEWETGGKTEQRHLTLNYDEQGTVTAFESVEPGLIEFAHFLEIATYPVVFKHPVHTRSGQS